VQLPAKLRELLLERADLTFELLQDLRRLRADRAEEIRLLASGHVLLLFRIHDTKTVLMSYRSS
jgi:hypothetical protein